MMPDDIDYMVYQAVSRIRFDLNNARKRLNLTPRTYTEPVIGLPSVQPEYFHKERP